MYGQITLTLLGQIETYRNALQKILSATENEQEPKIEIICVVGRDLKDWENHNGRKRSEEKLRIDGARVVLYDQLINNAFNAYQEFLEKSTYVEGRISQLLQKIEEDVED